MKIVVTVNDGSGVYYLGIAAEATSAIIEIPEEELPEIVKSFLNDKKLSKEKGEYFYSTLSFSLLDEPHSLPESPEGGEE